MKSHLNSNSGRHPGLVVVLDRFHFSHQISSLDETVRGSSSSADYFHRFWPFVKNSMKMRFIHQISGKSNIDFIQNKEVEFRISKETVNSLQSFIGPVPVLICHGSVKHKPASKLLNRYADLIQDFYLRIRFILDELDEFYFEISSSGPESQSKGCGRFSFAAARVYMKVTIHVKILAHLSRR